ncbi:MAG: hypothetical protein OXO52_21535 [Rhodospirillales bacterium]|nr:hypothetical protein [Rhodospirillales bacterium]MDE0381413.1 hypothetical protein [Rhodospirillales bacterium]
MSRDAQNCAKGRETMETSRRIGTLNVVQHAIAGSLRAVVVKSAHVVCVAAVSMLPLVAIAEAQSIDAARTAYIEGRFLETAELAESLGTSEGFALASRSVAVQAYYISGDDEKEALFERALALAQEAVRSDPDSPQAYIQLSHVMGRHGQTIGMLESASKGYADKIRDAVENALRLSPEMPEAHLSMGMWHSEVVSSLGSFMADMMFGADEDDAIEFYERALEGAPEEKIVPLEYAIGLLDLDDDDYREQARRLLQRAIELPVKDAYDDLIHQKAVETLAALDSLGD